MFSKFERMVALRYLRAKRKEGFISVITSFAGIGIALGVATLIIVTSVMNGFKAELLGRILGINGHISIVSLNNHPFNNYKEAVKNFEKAIKKGSSVEVLLSLRKLKELNIDSHKMLKLTTIAINSKKNPQAETYNYYVQSLVDNQNNFI